MNPFALLRRLFAREPPTPHTEAAEPERPVSASFPYRGAPLHIDDRTYNTHHPDYDANVVRNHPGRIINGAAPCTSAVFREILSMSESSEVSMTAWDAVLRDAMGEVMSNPASAQVFERKASIEAYAAEAEATHHAHYEPGWVSLDDALFLYWLVRRLKPATIVQTGVSNGLSSAFMVLALERNGGAGMLHAIDLPHIFDPNDPAWTAAGKLYGVMIPEGRTSGWIVPDACRGRFEVRQGNAKVLLAPLIDRLDTVDMLFHDSDHTYRHMLFEFHEVRRKLRPGGLIVADDIAWNASMWDCADGWNVPAYNHRGSVGVMFC